MSKISQKIRSLFFCNKKTFLFGFLASLFLFFSSVQAALAQSFWQRLVGAVTLIPMAAIALILLVAVLLSSFLAEFGSIVLNWVIGPNFIFDPVTNIPWSYTNPATNPIIKIGLDLTQPLVNMILVLVLVFIALATILRLAGYETKKLLPVFILVALLVNFAPVICGLIVDASNIVMNFFIGDVTGGRQLVSMLSSLRDSLSSNFVSGWDIIDVTNQMPLVLTLAVFVVVNLALFLILLLFAFIFMVRYIAIWLLVILSPLAFACYILPATRKFWSLWWNQFIQWSIIGITMGFFLYLADQFATKIPAVPAAAAAGIGGRILPALFPLAFLFLGFTFGLATGAMGATAIMTGFKKGYKASAKTAASRGWQWTRAGAGAVRQEAGRVQASYSTQRAVYGLTRTQALGSAIRGSWATRIRPAITRPATYVAAGRGVLYATRDVAMAGARAALGLKRRGVRNCPACGHPGVARSAITCPFCGATPI